MRNLLTGSLRLRLMILVVAAVIPALALLVYSDLQDRQKAISLAKSQVIEAARQASRSEARIIGQAHQLFLTLSHFPPFLRHDTVYCNAIFAELMQTSKGYSALLATKANGVTFATYPVKERPISLADRS